MPWCYNLITWGTEQLYMATRTVMVTTPFNDLCYLMIAFKLWTHCHSGCDDSGDSPPATLNESEAHESDHNSSPSQLSQSRGPSQRCGQWSLASQVPSLTSDVPVTLDTKFKFKVFSVPPPAAVSTRTGSESDLEAGLRAWLPLHAESSQAVHRDWIQRTYQCDEYMRSWNQDKM